MLGALQRMASGLDAMLASCDPALVAPRDAVALLDAVTSVERRAAAFKTLLAERAAEANRWAHEGYRSPEEWLSAKSGTSYSEAAATLEASAKLTDLPAVNDALRRGELSAPRTRELTSAATPANEQRLLATTKFL